MTSGSAARARWRPSLGRDLGDAAVGVRPDLRPELSEHVSDGAAGWHPRWMWWQILVGVLAGLALLYLALLATLWQAHRRDPDNTILMRDALRLLPDTVRLLRRLAGDRTLPRGVRIRLILLIVYLACPVDLIPDFIPVLGYADDAIIVAIALRSVIRRSGRAAIAEHWTGTPAGLRTIQRLAGISQ